MSKILLPEYKSERMKTSEIVREYRISQTTLWRWDKIGKLKPVGRIGHHKVYLRIDVDNAQSAEMLHRFNES